MLARRGGRRGSREACLLASLLWLLVAMTDYVVASVYVDLLTHLRICHRITLGGSLAWLCAGAGKSPRSGTCGRAGRGECGDQLRCDQSLSKASRIEFG